MAHRAVSRARGPGGTPGWRSARSSKATSRWSAATSATVSPAASALAASVTAVTSPGRLARRRLEAVPGLIDLPGEQEAPAEPHFQVGVQAVPPLAERDRRPPPGRRVLPGQQAVGGLGGGPGGIGGDLVAHAGPAVHGMVGQVGRLTPAGVPQRGEGPGVQSGPPGRRELLLYRVPDQRVDETVGPGTVADRADQPGVHRGIQGRDRGRRADRQGGGQRRILEVAAEHRGHLERLPAVGRKRSQPLPDHLARRCAAGRQAGTRR